MAVTPAPPRPGADDVLVEAWRRPPGFVGWLMAVNHKQIGMRFIVTALAFFAAGGIEALLIRTQLATPESGFLGAEGYNEAFSLHGTTMMFLFAVPVLEGLGMYFLPLMLGTRDLPFPRLNAFGYWCFLFGGLFVYASLIGGDAPSEGWFAYVPLSGPEFAPGDGMDFWLLGVTLAEVAAIVGAIELLVAFVSRRAPGMSINRIPIFAWAIAATAAMIVLAFPALVTGSLMLESERVFGTHFFNPALGGDALLWQHLFWFFGHPEVYIILLPATGIVSMVVPVFARRPIAGYPFVVAATLAIALISFGLWVHHMFTTGLALLALSFFAAASFLIVIPNGVQVFAWLATMWRGRPAFQTPLLFVLGFVFIFLLGGITGVMVAAVPFNWQVHDTFFVVAHLHYVLIGGMVFPLFGGLYYWFPKWTGRLLGERLGQASFWTMFAGFNLAFFPQHILGIDGMPRRVFTYQRTDGWETLNLLSTMGAYVLAAGILVTAVNMAVSWRGGRPGGADPWAANSLEWATSSPPPPYNFKELPVVGSADPLWAPIAPEERTAALVEELTAPSAPFREVIETSPIDARPERVVHLPGPTLWPLAVGVALLAALIGALEHATILAVAGTALTVALLIGWGGSTIRESASGLPRRTLPVWRSGAGWWAMAIGNAVLAVILLSLLYGYGEIASGAGRWPPPGVSDPVIGWPLAAAAAAVVAYVAVRLSGRALAGARRPRVIGGLLAALGSSLALAGLAGMWLASMDVSGNTNAYGSIVYALVAYVIALAGALVIAAGFVGWLVLRGAVGPERHVSLLVLRLYGGFVAAAALVSFATVWVGARIA